MDKLTYDHLSERSSPGGGEAPQGDDGPPGGEAPQGGDHPDGKSLLLGWGALEQAAQCLRSVAHPVRLRILELLVDGEYSVGELAELCEVDQPTASGHLGQLRSRGILQQDRRGRHVYYRVATPAMEGIVSCMRKNFGPSSTGEGCRG